MRKYVKPNIEYVKLTPEERLAVCDSEGWCPTESPDWDGNGIPDLITLS